MPSRKGRSLPSLRARLLGERLRAWREERGLTLKYVAATLHKDFSDMARVERGERALHLGEAASLLDLLAVYESAERDFLFRLARDAYRLRLWEGDFDGPELDASIVDSLWLESVAERIRCYGAVSVPDLLRTPAYAEAVVYRERSAGVSEPMLEWWTRSYGRRQREVFERRPMVSVEAVVAEAALRCPLGGPDVWRAQLEHLATGGDDGSVQLRLLPASAGFLAGMDGSFTVFDPPAKYLPAVACRPYADIAALHEGATAGWYADAFDRLWDFALPAGESMRFITELIADACELTEVSDRRSR